MCGKIFRIRCQQWLNKVAGGLRAAAIIAQQIRFADRETRIRGKGGARFGYRGDGGIGIAHQGFDFCLRLIQRSGVRKGCQTLFRDPFGRLQVAIISSDQGSREIALGGPVRARCCGGFAHLHGRDIQAIGTRRPVRRIFRLGEVGKQAGRGRPVSGCAGLACLHKSIALIVQQIQPVRQIDEIEHLFAPGRIDQDGPGRCLPAQNRGCLPRCNG